uniref:Uncharacterized protein n=1 Tax=Ditylenchus dipsaci TaxID=166011 RepID=A0A915CS60_9BILA
MSLPLPKFASESGSFQCNWDKRSPANSISGSATGLDVVQRSPPMSATVQKSSFSSKFFSGSQQEDKEADAPQDPRGKDTSASLCSPAKSVDLEGSARSILGFSPEPEKPAKPKNFDPLAELFKNVAPAAPSSLAKRLTEFRNKYKDVEQKIQETKMNVFAASSSRKPTSLEQELERLQSRSNTLSGLSLDTTSHQDPLDMPKRSLSIHIPSSSARVNKPSSPSSTLQNLKKGFNLSNLEHDQYHSTPTSQSSPVLAKSEAGDQSLSFLPQNSQLRQSPQLATTTSVFQGTFRPSSSSVSSPRPINLPNQMPSPHPH